MKCQEHRQSTWHPDLAQQRAARMNLGVQSYLGPPLRTLAQRARELALFSYDHQEGYLRRN